MIQFFLLPNQPVFYFNQFPAVILMIILLLHRRDSLSEISLNPVISQKSVFFTKYPIHFRTY